MHLSTNILLSDFSHALTHFSGKIYLNVEYLNKAVFFHGDENIFPTSKSSDLLEIPHEMKSGNGRKNLVVHLSLLEVRFSHDVTGTSVSCNNDKYYENYFPLPVMKWGDGKYLVNE